MKLHKWFVFVLAIVIIALIIFKWEEIKKLFSKNGRGTRGGTGGTGGTGTTFDAQGIADYLHNEMKGLTLTPATQTGIKYVLYQLIQRNDAEFTAVWNAFGKPD